MPEEDVTRCHFTSMTWTPSWHGAERLMNGTQERIVKGSYNEVRFSYTQGK